MWFRASPSPLPSLQAPSPVVRSFKHLFYLCGVRRSPFPFTDTYTNTTTVFLLLDTLSFCSFFCFPSLNWSGYVKPSFCCLTESPSFPHRPLQSENPVLYCSNIRKQQTRPLSLSKTKDSLLLFVSPLSVLVVIAREECSHQPFPSLSLLSLLF